MKTAYHDKILNAVGCIDKLERSLSSKAQTYEKLLIYNRQLKAKLGTEPVVRTDRNYIYRCEDCHRQGLHVEGLRDVRSAFTHQDRHHPLVGAKTSTKVTRRTRQPNKVLAPKSESVHLLRCRHCPTTTFDSSVLQLHSLLHKDLVLFQCPWPQCAKLFGVPSKLKRSVGAGWVRISIVHSVSRTVLKSCYFACSSLVLNGIRIVGFLGLKCYIIKVAPMP